MEGKKTTIKINKNLNYVVCGHINIKAVETKAETTKAETFGIYCRVCDKTYWFDVVR